MDVGRREADAVPVPNDNLIDPSKTWLVTDLRFQNTRSKKSGMDCTCISHFNQYNSDTISIQA